MNLKEKIKGHSFNFRRKDGAFENSTIFLKDLFEIPEIKQLIITDVVASVLCLDSSKFGFVQEGEKYELIKEGDTYFTIYDDEGDVSTYEKECFKKL